VGGLAAPVPGPLGLAVAADAGGRDQGRVHERARPHRDALRLELAGDGLEQRPIEPARDQLAAEPDEGGAFGRRLVGGETAEAAEAGAVVQRLASRTSERSCQVASSRARNSASGGQPGSPLSDAEMPVSARSISAQSISAANSVSDDAALGSGRAMRSSCPIRRRAIARLPPMAPWNQSTPRRLKHIRAHVSLHTRLRKS
jgi:hypothetical protein